jgi:hypothetical protein
MTDRKEPLPQVLLVAAGLTFAKNALRNDAIKAGIKTLLKKVRN